MTPKRSPISGASRGWMWRNTEVVEFIDWLRAHNDALPRDALSPECRKVGFLRSRSLQSARFDEGPVLQYLEGIDPDAANERGRYASVRPFWPRPADLRFFRRHRPRQILAKTRWSANSSSCAPPRRTEYAGRDGSIAEEEFFYCRAKMRAWSRTPKNITARCFRGKCRRGTCATAIWSRRSRRWWHTSVREGSAPRSSFGRIIRHLGDARATAMGHRGELNVGQLVRTKI